VLARTLAAQSFKGLKQQQQQPLLMSLLLTMMQR
jgi:hypothetical protein